LAFTVAMLALFIGLNSVEQNSVNIAKYDFSGSYVSSENWSNNFTLGAASKGILTSYFTGFQFILAFLFLVTALFFVREVLEAFRKQQEKRNNVF
jgi:hypothetical protein